MRRLTTAAIDYFLPPGIDSASLSITDLNGRVVRVIAADQHAGIHRATWDLTYPGATTFPGIVLEGGNPARGVLAPPGTYRVTLTTVAAGTRAVRSQSLVVTRDPGVAGVTDLDLRAQFALATQVRDAESAANEAVIRIRRLRELEPGRFARDTAFARELAAVEGELYQVRNQSPKDKIAFPIKLNDRLTGLRAIIESGDGPPTASQRRVFNELKGQLDLLLLRLSRVLGGVS